MSTFRALIRANRARALTAAVCVVVIAVCVVQAFGAVQVGLQAAAAVTGPGEDSTTWRRWSAPTRKPEPRPARKAGPGFTT